MLTSTDHTFAALADPVPVGTYTRDQSIAYLTARTRLTDPQGADQVADALGDLAGAENLIRPGHGHLDHRGGEACAVASLAG